MQHNRCQRTQYRKAWAIYVARAARRHSCLPAHRHRSFDLWVASQCQFGPVRAILHWCSRTRADCAPACRANTAHSHLPGALQAATLLATHGRQSGSCGPEMNAPNAQHGSCMPLAPDNTPRTRRKRVPTHGTLQKATNCVKTLPSCHFHPNSHSLRSAIWTIRFPVGKL